MRFNTDDMRLNKPVPSFQYLTKIVFCQINYRIFFPIEIIRVCISCGLGAERPDTGHYRKASPTPWARKLEITCFLAQGVGEAFL